MMRVLSLFDAVWIDWRGIHVSCLFLAVSFSEWPDLWIFWVTCCESGLYLHPPVFAWLKGGQSDAAIKEVIHWIHQQEDR